MQDSRRFRVQFTFVFLPESSFLPNSIISGQDAAYTLSAESSDSLQVDRLNLAAVAHPPHAFRRSLNGLSDSHLDL